MSLKISVSTKKPAEVKTELLVVLLGEDEKLPAVFSSAVQRELKALMHKVGYKPLWGNAKMFLAPSHTQSQFIGFIGVGSLTPDTNTLAEGIRRGFGKLVHEAREHAIHDMCVVLQKEKHTAQLAAACVEGVALAGYEFAKHKSSQNGMGSRSIRHLQILCLPKEHAGIQEAVNRTQNVLKGVDLTRNLVNEPASHVVPKALAAIAKNIAKNSKSITVKILNRKQATKQKFHAFLAVARGSSEEPFVIHLVYKPKKYAKKRVVLVGKGVTFDSGGLSLKPAPMMENMKIDMGGAATVLGVFSVLELLQPQVEVHGIIAACENMISGQAYRPGDVITAKNGKTIEVLNTDAEGRITLADALSYATALKPDAIVDLATLTGACMVALGDTQAGLWSTNDSLRDKLLRAASEAGEGLVAMPLVEEYMKTIESKVADVRNIASMSTGGAITAALFLREFVGSVPWAHIDMAGPVFSERPLISYWTYGGTGYGVRTLARYILEQ